MHDFSQCELTLEFDFGSTNGKYMEIKVNGRKVTPDQPHIKLSIYLPTTIQLDLSNKGPNDTIVDSSGNIVQDCYIKLKAMVIDGFTLNEKWLNQKIILNTVDGQQITSNYFGFNGTVTLVLGCKSVLAQCLYMNL
jgi:hypothetical protein